MPLRCRLEALKTGTTGRSLGMGGQDLSLVPLLGAQGKTSVLISVLISVSRKFQIVFSTCQSNLSHVSVGGV